MVNIGVSIALFIAVIVAQSAFHPGAKAALLDPYKYTPLPTGCAKEHTLFLQLAPKQRSCVILKDVLVNRFNERAIMVGGLMLQAIAMAWIGLISRPDMAYPELVAPLMIAGFGAAVIPASQNAVVSSVEPAEIGKASGIFNMLRQLGAAFGVAILVAVFARAGSFNSARTFVDGFAPAMGVSAGLSLLGAATGMALPGRRTKAMVPAKA
jgi:MFS family permease